MAIAGYNFYENGVKLNSSLLTIPNYVRTGLPTPGSTHSCYFTAVDDSGNESSAGDTKSVTLATVPVGNTPPVANAGSDNTITLPTNSVTLVGSGTDSDGTIASYAWSKVSGGAATLTTPNAATTTVTGLVQGAYVFQLLVTDNQGATHTDQVSITVNAAGPLEPLNAPVLVSMTENADDTLTVTWADTNTTPNEFKYEIEADTVNTFNSGTSLRKVFLADANATTATFAALTVANNFFVRGRAKGDGVTTQDSAWSTPLPYTPVPPATWGNFNGSTSQLSRAGNFDLNQDFEITFFFYMAATQTGLPGLVTNQTTAEFDSKKGLVAYTGGDAVSMQVYSNSTIIQLNTNLGTSKDTWHQTKIQRTGNTLFLIVNGKVSSATVGTLTNSTSNLIRYGTWYDGGANRRLNGRMASLVNTTNIAHTINDLSTGTDTSGNNNHLTVANVTPGP